METNTTKGLIHNREREETHNRWSLSSILELHMREAAFHEREPGEPGEP